MQLEEFFDYKNKLISDILTDSTIVKLINEDTPVEDAQSLVYKLVFPYEYVPETIEHGDTYICCDVDIDKAYNKTYLKPIIYVWVFTHKSLLRLPEGGVRVDRLCSEICKKINGSMGYGLGELGISSVRRFAPMTDYLGKCMVFEAKEFNRQYNPSKFIPSNRKQ